MPAARPGCSGPGRSRASGAALPRTARTAPGVSPVSDSAVPSLCRNAALAGACSTRRAEVSGGGAIVAGVERADAARLLGHRPPQQPAQLHHQRIRRAHLHPASLAQVRFRLGRVAEAAIGERQRIVRDGRARDPPPAPAPGNSRRARSRAAPARRGQGRRVAATSLGCAATARVNSGSASSGVALVQVEVAEPHERGEVAGLQLERRAGRRQPPWRARRSPCGRGPGSTASAPPRALVPGRGAGRARRLRSIRRPCSSRPDFAVGPAVSDCWRSCAAAPQRPCCERSGSATGGRLARWGAVGRRFRAANHTRQTPAGRRRSPARLAARRAIIAPRPRAAWCSDRPRAGSIPPWRRRARSRESARHPVAAPRPTRTRGSLADA